jgi:hypothetical protein
MKDLGLEHHCSSHKPRNEFYELEYDLTTLFLHRRLHCRLLTDCCHILGINVLDLRQLISLRALDQGHESQSSRLNTTATPESAYLWTHKARRWRVPSIQSPLFQFPTRSYGPREDVSSSLYEYTPEVPFRNWWK